jgi:hypothetical protein
MTTPFYKSIALLVFTVAVLIISGIGVNYASSTFDYYDKHPTYYPRAADGWNPIDGSLNCIILNHTYFEREDSLKVIDVYARPNSSHISHPVHAVRYYQEFLQSCRCHNASYVNKTIDDEFPISKTVDCSINDDWTQFRVNYTGSNAYYEPSDKLPLFSMIIIMLYMIIIVASVLGLAILVYIGILWKKGTLRQQRYAVV